MKIPLTKSHRPKIVISEIISDEPSIMLRVLKNKTVYFI